MSKLLCLKQSLKFNTCRGKDGFYFADAIDSFIPIQSHKFLTFNNNPLLELYNFMVINVFFFMFFFLGK